MLTDLKVLRKVGIAYTLYMFLYSGLEFTLSFLVHSRFNYDRLEWKIVFY